MPWAKTAHGKRLATLFQCSGCHGADYSGSDFGAGFPIVKGLWASNISRAIPAMSDAALEPLQHLPRCRARRTG